MSSLERKETELHGNGYLVGWCPDCGRVSVLRGDDEPTCGCGHELLSLTGCADLDEVSHAIHVIEGIRDAALGHTPSLKEEAERCRAASERLGSEDDKSITSLLDAAIAGVLHNMALLDELADRLDIDLGQDDADEAPDDVEKDETDDGGERRFVFMLAPSPFGVAIRAKDLGEASAWLTGHMTEVAQRGLSNALFAGEVDFHVIPVSGGVTWSCRPGEDD